MKTTLYADGEELTLEYNKDGDTYDVALNGKFQCTQVVASRDGAVTLIVDGNPLQAYVVCDGTRSLVSIAGLPYEFDHELPKQSRTRRRGASGGFEPEILSPMPGKILEVKIAEGETVEAGQTLILLEAMKMENVLTAEGSARITKIHVTDGDLVELGQVLVELVELEPLKTK